MVAGSILPVAMENGKLYFLFGKENPMENSAKGFSDFGGRIEKNESPFEGALREGAEELTGFLGNKQQLKKYIKSVGGPLVMDYNGYHVHIIPIKYDENLVSYYNNNHAFLWNNMNKKLLNKTKLFEKIEIRWFNTSDIYSKIKLFRPFYREIIIDILKGESVIKDYVNAKKAKL